MSLIADEDIDSILNEEINNESCCCYMVHSFQTVVEVHRICVHHPQSIVGGVRIYDEENTPQFEINEAYNDSSSQIISDGGAFAESAFDAIESTAQYIETVACKTDGFLNEVNLNLLDVGQEVTLMLDVVSSELIDNNDQRDTNNFQEITPQGSKDKENLNLLDVVGSEFIVDEHIDENHFQEITPQGSKDKEILSSDNMEISSSEESDSSIEKTRTRKRTVNKKNWKSEIRKRKRQRGKEYKDRKGNIHRGRTIQGDCRGNCKFKCAININHQAREKIHTKFWSLSETGKNHFYSKFVERQPKNNKRVMNENNRQFSYFYYLGSESDKIRVCKECFLKTLDVSQRRIYWFFQHVYSDETCTARSPLKGSKTKSHIDNDIKQEVREHINSFPKVEAHYCRKDSQKEYLEGDLSLAAMYRLYVAKVKTPVKESLYRSIFNREFNLEFFKPKKDRCDTCEAFKANVNPSQQDVDRINRHITEKDSVKLLRDMDRDTAKMTKKAENTCVVAFDLENVLALPRAEVSNFFYKRKLNCYNLTAHSMYRGQTRQYCVVWHEAVSGRAGNNLASCVFKVLKTIIASDNDIGHFILWSDACVPQNKNSIMTLALQTFLKENPSVNGIKQRFSEPGHGVVQEVDNIHSKIEKWLKRVEVFSPVSLVRLLVKKSQADGNTQMSVIQMQQKDFFDFQLASKSLNYSVIPYTKLKEIILNSVDLFIVQYRLSFTSEDLIQINIKRGTPRKKRGSTEEHPKKKSKTVESSSSNKAVIPVPKVLTMKPELTEEKKKDIKSMMKFMPPEDKIFFNALFRSTS